jgi:DNA-binding SARP family transcriptional activator
MRLRERPRLEAMMAALAMVGGDYLPDAATKWACEQRRAVAVTATELRLETADTAYQLGDLMTAHREVEQVIADSPYQERAWQLAMRVAGDLGHNDRVLEIYLACRAKLAEVPATPSPTTTGLLDRLRR